MGETEGGGFSYLSSKSCLPSQACISQTYPRSRLHSRWIRRKGFLLNISSPARGKELIRPGGPLALSLDLSKENIFKLDEFPPNRLSELPLNPDIWLLLIIWFCPNKRNEQSFNFTPVHRFGFQDGKNGQTGTRHLISRIQGSHFCFYLFAYKL